MKRFCILFVLLLLAGCGAPTPTAAPTDAPTPVPPVAPVETEAPKRTQEPAVTPIPVPEISALQVSDRLEGRSVAAEANAGGEFEHYLYSDEPLYDVLVSEIYMEPEGDELVFLETGSVLYLPVLPVGQAIRLIAAMPETIPFVQVSYCTDAGAYEVAQLCYNGRDGGAMMVPAEPQLKGALYLGEEGDGGAPMSYIWASEDVIDLLESGALEGYIPTGFTVFDGAYADINGDGIGDVVLALVSDGSIVAGMYYADLPVHILLGQAGGGFKTAQRFESGLFMPYRSDCRVEAGEGYIEFHYSLVGGAMPHYTAVFRFGYDGAAKNWSLSEYGYCFTYLPDEAYTEQSPEMIAAPAYLQARISSFDMWETLDSFQPEQYEAVESMPVGVLYSFESDEASIVVAVNRTATGYEGTVFRRYEFDDGVYDSIICTIKGGLAAGDALSITTDEESGMFIIGNSAWSWFPDYETFFKNEG